MSISMNAAELGARVFALEAVVLAVAAELAALGSQQAAGLTTAINDCRDGILKELMPNGAVAPLEKEIVQHTNSYVAGWLKNIEEERAKIVEARNG